MNYFVSFVCFIVLLMFYLSTVNNAVQNVNG